MHVGRCAVVGKKTKVPEVSPFCRVFNKGHRKQRARWELHMNATVIKLLLFSGREKRLIFSQMLAVKLLHNSFSRAVVLLHEHCLTLFGHSARV